ncbi:MAG: VPLPA-CTERM-specific exosortase XrtD [Leptothrix sp. (in: b-proteobacteria)]
MPALCRSTPDPMDPMATAQTDNRPGAPGPICVARATDTNLAVAWVLHPAHWLLLTLTLGALIWAFLPGLEFMVATWAQVEEYSYGYFIPLVSAFLIWQRSDVLRREPLHGHWGGLVLLAIGLLFELIGERSAIRLIGQYGFIIAVVGAAVGLIGWRGARLLAMPLAILLFMIPLPQFLLRELSQQLQLLSSQLGVAIIRLCGISVYLEGNVIDLGSYKLQVVEACNGLRYLFPLLILGCLAAYFFQARAWKRLVLIASTVPLTIVINSLRIGLIGVTVENWGQKMAEGLLHDFEGFFMFMLCLVLLFAEMTLLARVGGPARPLREVFGLEFPEPIAKGTPRHLRGIALPALAALLLVALAALAQGPAPAQIKPERRAFASFPMRLDGGWVGKRDRLDADVLATLAVDDHLIANYSRSAQEPWVNFYTAWYDTQSSGASSHSPRTCIPGGGWAITLIADAAIDLPDSAYPGGMLRVNRTVIRKVESQQLVYYWFQQRGRTLTNEFAVKWYIFLDGITRNRSDGALVRLVTPVGAGEGIDAADARLRNFMLAAAPHLGAYLPD